ncbi:MAG: hypothetical protein K0R31_2008 [Clostridiales bacterium]|jgi:hypothetical protein|nr:hypothetical protein [Clostridiales bacterium]
MEEAISSAIALGFYKTYEEAFRVMVTDISVLIFYKCIQLHPNCMRQYVAALVG